MRWLGVVRRDDRFLVGQEVAHRPDTLRVRGGTLLQLENLGQIHRASRRRIPTRHIVEVEVLGEVGESKAQRCRRSTPKRRPRHELYDRGRLLQILPHLNEVTGNNLRGRHLLKVGADARRRQRRRVDEHAYALPRVKRARFFLATNNTTCEKETSMSTMETTNNTTERQGRRTHQATGGRVP